MKFMRKITCYVLSAALVSAMALPALAAENLSKTETVYTVLNADGSVSSQSVSVKIRAFSPKLSVPADRAVLHRTERLSPGM